MMDEASREEVGRSVAEILGDYGAEVFGVLRAVLGDRMAAREVYGAIADALFEALPGHRICRGRPPLRIWVYATMRIALVHHWRNDPNDRKGRIRQVELPGGGAYRSAGMPRLRALAPVDRVLLVLCVARRFSYREIAQVTLGGRASERRLLEEAARIRRRLRRLRDELLRPSAPSPRSGSLQCLAKSTR